MGIASEDEWEQDPELRELRRDFLSSFTERRGAIEALVPALIQGKPGQDAFEKAVAQAAKITHKLAGAAETYGFPTVTQACSALEDRLDQCPVSERSPSELVEVCALIADLLNKAQELTRDPSELASDPRLVALLGRLRS